MNDRKVRAADLSPMHAMPPDTTWVGYREIPPEERAANRRLLEDVIRSIDPAPRHSRAGETPPTSL